MLPSGFFNEELYIVAQVMQCGTHINYHSTNNNPIDEVT